VRWWAVIRTTRKRPATAWRTRSSGPIHKTPGPLREHEGSRSGRSGVHRAVARRANRANGMSTRPRVRESRTSRSTGHTRTPSAVGRTAAGPSGLRSGCRTVPATGSLGTGSLRRPPGPLSGERSATFDGRLRNHWYQVSFALPTGERNVVEQLDRGSR
jgi:hypothetical protein